MNRPRKFWIFTAILLVAFITSVIIVKNKYLPESKAEENNITKINIIFSEGKIPNNNNENEKILFDDVSISTSKTVSNTLIIPEKTFSDEIKNIKLNKENIIDCETFYFEKFSSNEEIQNALNSGKLWAYSFTGWHIVGTNTYIPQQTVFQPGDPILPEVLEAQGIIKINEDETVTVLKELQLEALWGKCYFVSSSGSSTNKGNDYTKPYNSINVNTDSSNAFSSVIMLTDNITRKGQINPSGTIKSLQKEKRKKI